MKTRDVRSVYEITNYYHYHDGHIKTVTKYKIYYWDFSEYVSYRKTKKIIEASNNAGLNWEINMIEVDKNWG